MFVDKTRLFVQAGHGGNGALSFRREKYVEMGGPDGGNGGQGGSVYFEADPHMTTLQDLAVSPHVKASSGDHGQSANKTGRSGEDKILRIPPGTLVFKEGKLIADLKKPGERVLVAKGGRGGRGNQSFKTSINTAPRIAEKGEPGENTEIHLELKLLADVGMVGFPNAGKSTFLSHTTKARPKIADYPFTTLTPNLGVAHVGERSFVLADIPGLIEGAHSGRGLGDEFLRHIERTRVLIHLVDVTGYEGRTAYENFKALNKELGAYNKVILEKPQIIVANKMDLTDSDKLLAAFQKKMKKAKIYAISGVTGKGLPQLLTAVLKVIDKAPEMPLYIPPIETEFTLEPDFQVELEHNGFRISGKKVDRLIAMTNFEQDEAVARLQKIFRKMGVEKALDQKGARVGDQVFLGNFQFSYRPEPKKR